MKTTKAQAAEKYAKLLAEFLVKGGKITVIDGGHVPYKMFTATGLQQGQMSIVPYSRGGCDFLGGTLT